MTIVCGVDGSPAARDAVSAAALLAGMFGQELVLVYAVERLVAVGYPPHGRMLDRYTHPGPSGDEPLAGVGKRILEVQVEELRLDPLTAQRVEIGEPAQVLVDVAETEGAELIVVGTRGRGKVASAFLGSVSSAVVSLSSCPVLVVPSGAAIGRGVVVCGVDDSTAARQAARVARAVAEALGVEVVLVHAVPTMIPPGMSAVPRGPADVAATEHRAAEEFLATLAHDEGLGAAAERRVAYGSQADAIRDVADEVNAALVVVGTRRRGALRSALAGSVSRDLKSESSKPVLIVPTGTRVALRT
jgi:nucleotide-binding universal stress UspA family protein